MYIRILFTNITTPATVNSYIYLLNGRSTYFPIIKFIITAYIHLRTTHYCKHLINSIVVWTIWFNIALS